LHTRHLNNTKHGLFKNFCKKFLGSQMVNEEGLFMERVSQIEGCLKRNYSILKSSHHHLCFRKQRCMNHFLH